MSNEKMGGPAFPTDSEHQSGPNTWHYEGMTLWDYYAAAALQGLIATGSHDCTFCVYANAAARQADAMLAERAKRVKAES